MKDDFYKIGKLMVNAAFHGDKYITFPLNMFKKTYDEIKSWCGENSLRCNLLKNKTSVRIEWED